MNSTLADTTIEPDRRLNDRQLVTIYTLTIVSAYLSFLGSSAIGCKVLRNMRSSKPYDRFLLGLSSCDIIASFTHAITPFLLPKETSTRAWALGTDSTCITLGFLTQFSYSAIAYNACLSFYFLLTVRFGVKRKELSRRYEPWMHAAVWVFFLGTASTGVAIGMFSEMDMGPGCWIRDYPNGCYETGGCIGHFFGWFFAGVPSLLAFFAVSGNNLAVYGYCRRVFKSGPNSAMNADQQARIQEVASQGMLYVGSFFLCFTWLFILRILESSSFPASREAELFPLMVIDATLRPLQGIFNLLIYVGPNYRRLRMANPGMRRRSLIRKAIFDPNIPRLETVNCKTNSRPASANRRYPSKKSSLLQKRVGSNFQSSLPAVNEASRESDSVVDDIQQTCEGRQKKKQRSPRPASHQAIDHAGRLSRSALEPKFERRIPGAK